MRTDRRAAKATGFRAAPRRRASDRARGLRLESLEARCLLAIAPQGYWRFDSNGDDASGGGHSALLVNGAAFSTDTRAGTGGSHSISFDGTNDYVAINPMDVSESAFTLSLWFKTVSGASNRGVFSVAVGGTLPPSNSDRNVYLLGTNIAGQVKNASFPAGEAIVSSGRNYSDAAWHHLVYTFGPGVGQRLYIDGNATPVAGPGNSQSSNVTAQDRILIGYSSPAALDYFRGVIDEVAVWDQALTAGQAQALYNGTSPLSLPRNGLTARWAADDLAVTLADDAVVSSWTSGFGGRPATGSGSPTLQTEEINGHAAVRFQASDGADTFRVAAADSPLAGAGDFTVAVVFRTATNGTGGVGQWTENTGLVDASQPGETADWGLAINGDGQVAAGMGDPDLTTYSAAGKADGSVHVAILTRRGASTTLYVDGGDGLANDSGAAARAMADLVFGALQTGVNPFTGDIAEVQTFNLAMSTAEAYDLAAELGNRYEVDLTTPTPPGPPALVAHWVADDLSVGAVASWASRVGTVAATLGESDPAAVAGQLNGHKVVQFDGNDSLLVPGAENPLALAGDFSLLTVARLQSPGAAGANWWQNSGIVDMDISGNAADWGLAVDESGRFVAGLGSAAGTNLSVPSAQSGLANSSGHVIAVTRSGGTLSLYVDGVPMGSASSGSLASRVASQIAFGRIQSGGNYMTGDLAEVRMYGGALSSGEVASLSSELMSTYAIVRSIAVAGELLVDLRASDPTAGTATWNNLGTLGDFARVGNPAVQTIQGVTAVALNFDHPVSGWDDAFVGPLAPSTLTGADDRTIEIWAYNPSDGQQQAEETAVAWGRRGGPAGTNLTFGYGNHGTWGAVGHWDTPDMPWFVGGGSPTLGQWHHLAYVFDGTITRVYADGVQTNSETTALSTHVGSTINLGAQNGTGGTISLTEGQAGSLALANVRVHSGALSASDVLANYFAGIQLATTPPTAVADSYNVSEDGARNEAAPGVLANDLNPSGLPLTAILDATTGHGTLALAADGSFDYQPAADYFGPDSFSYHARSGGIDSPPVTVSITVDPVYDPVVASADGYVVATGQLFAVSAPGVLANDSNPDNVARSALLDLDVSHGTLSLRSDGSFDYQPEPGYVGDDSFTYHVFDGTSNSNVAAVVLTVDTPPVADDDSYSTYEDTPLSVPAPGVLVGDSDVQMQPLTALLVAGPTHGNLAIAPDGSFVYTPGPNYFGPDGFTYRASDGDQLSNLATVSLDVQAVNDAPRTLPDGYTSFMDQAITNTAATGVLRNDSDVDGPSLAAELVAAPPVGSLSFQSDGSFTYTPPLGFVGAVTFTYRAIDTAGGESAETPVMLAIQSRDRQIVINEIHYDPPDNTVPAEFVEFYNSGTTTVDLSSWYFSSGVSYTFPPGTTMAPGAYLLVAEDPATILSLYGQTALGPWTGALTNEGEEIRLRNALGETVDRVDYGVAFPWPTGAAGDGGSIELIHPSLDNELGGSWRTSTASFNLPDTAQSLIGATDANWHYRKGDSEASSPISAWRQTGFAEDATWAVARTSIGYGDGDDNTLLADMLGNYTSLYLRHEFTLSGAVPDILKLRVYIDDGAVVWINGHEVGRYFVSDGEKQFSDVTGQAGAEPVWGDGLLSGAASYLVSGTNTLAIHALNAAIGSSDFSVDAELIVPAAGDLPAQPTPGALNSEYATNAAPQSRQLSHTPQAPTTSEATVVTIKVTDPDGVSSVDLHYQVVLPGQYIPAYLPVPLATLQANPNTPRPANPAYHDPANWTTIAMVDDGSGGDAVAQDGFYTATIPAQAINRTLVRYRVAVADSLGASVTVPYADDPALNFAYYVYDGVPDYNGHPAAELTALPVYSFLTRAEDWAQTLAWNPADQMPQGSPNLARFEYNWYGTMVYGGAVYDNISYRLRGANGRYLGGNTKRSMKFNFNTGHFFQAYDQDGNKYPTKWSILTTGKGFDNRLTLTYALNEHINYYLFNQIGVPAPASHFFHFRVVDGAVEAPDQYNGDFWGLNWAQENYDVRFLEAHDLPKGNIYKLINSTNNPDLEQRYQGPLAVSDGSDYWTIENNLTGASTSAFIQNHVNLDNWYRFHALAEAVRHYDYWPSANKNFTWYFDDDYREENESLGQLWSLPWDTDASWGPTWNNGHDVVYNALFASGDAGGDALSHPEFWPAYFSVLRELRDLLWQPDQINPLIDHFAAKIAEFVEADRDRWLNGPLSAGNYTGIGGVGKTSFAAYVQDLKNFAFLGGSWPGGDVGAGGRAAFLDTLQNSSGEAGQFPGTPTISYDGAAGYPLDTLIFQTTPFADPQGAGTFAALQWRVATYTDRNSPSYDPSQPFKLEYNADWDSGPLATFSSSITIPANAVEVGKVYRARVRMQDTSGRWSHWSAPIEFTVGAPLGGQTVRDFLRISELHYHPADPTSQEVGAGFTEADAFEFVELYNTSSSVTLNLDGVRFTNGVDFDFGLAGTTLGPGQYAVLASNQAAFQQRYGLGVPLAGVYSGQFNNAGERVELTDSLGVDILDFTYDDVSPWYPATDGDGPSLVFVDPLLDASAWGVAANWRPSYDSGGSPGEADLPAASVVARHVFYNNSAFDGNNPAAGASDDGAIASDKSALLPGQTATLANYTSFSKGINGILIDVANLRGLPTAADFSFRTGNNNNLAAWTTLATAPAVSLRPGAGAGGSTRITLTWPDGTITKRWLQVTLLATPITGLPLADVFYFGNAVGESGNSTTDAVVNATDEIGARTHPVGPFPTGAVTNLYDFNRDRLVNATDQIIARTNGTNPLTALRLISVPAETGSGALAADLALASLANESLASGDVSRRRRRGT